METVEDVQEVLARRKKEGIVSGFLQITSKGYGFIAPSPDDGLGDIYIPAKAQGGALDGDIVDVKITQQVPGRKREGAVVGIGLRNHSIFVGVYQETPKGALLIPDDEKIPPILIDKEDRGKARTGQKVIVKIKEWPTAEKPMRGIVSDILGNPTDLGVDILSIIKKYELPTDFPPAVLRQAAMLPKAVTNREKAGYIDLTKIPFVTIDGEDAKDLDDAVYVRKEGNTYVAMVAIADVSHYVEQFTPLDKEAFVRATSVYPVDRVIPMLPEKLSNGICSLNEGQERLTLTALIYLDEEFSPSRFDFKPAVIKVRHRLTYPIVNDLLANAESIHRFQYRDVVPMLQLAAQVTRELKKIRTSNGAIDFNLTEEKVILDTKGHPVAVEKREQGQAERLIEELMIVANIAAAVQLYASKAPGLYRVHPAPEMEKVKELARLLRNFNIFLPVTDKGVTALDIQQALAKMHGRPEEKLVETIALRSMQQACYKMDEMGHFALAMPCYTHFTAPIRRYADLSVHRLLKERLRQEEKGTELTEEEEAMEAFQLKALANHVSSCERTAEKVERESTKLKIAEYMLEHKGEKFPGTISSVTQFGFFVELANGVEGLVSLRSLTDDYYVFEEDNYLLRGRRKDKVYRLGDKVEIEVLGANIEERTVDFVLAGMEQGEKEYLRQSLAGKVQREREKRRMGHKVLSKEIRHVHFKKLRQKGGRH